MFVTIKQLLVSTFHDHMELPENMIPKNTKDLLAAIPDEFDFALYQQDISFIFQEVKEIYCTEEECEKDQSIILSIIHDQTNVAELLRVLESNTNKSFTKWILKFLNDTGTHIHYTLPLYLITLYLTPYTLHLIPTLYRKASERCCHKETISCSQ